MLRATQDSDQLIHHFRYGTFTPFGWPFQCHSPTAPTLSVGPTTPIQSKPYRFGLLRFRSPLLTEYSLLLRVLRCFSSPSSPLTDYVFICGWSGIPRTGFPHSDICGSQLYHNSPQLFAVIHVLLRPLTPRHPPCALSSLTTPSFLKEVSFLKELFLHF